MSTKEGTGSSSSLSVALKAPVAEPGLMKSLPSAQGWGWGWGDGWGWGWGWGSGSGGGWACGAARGSGGGWVGERWAAGDGGLRFALGVGFASGSPSAASFAWFSRMVCSRLSSYSLTLDCSDGHLARALNVTTWSARWRRRRRWRRLRLQNGGGGAALTSPQHH